MSDDYHSRLFAAEHLEQASDHLDEVEDKTALETVIVMFCDIIEEYLRGRAEET